MIETFEPVPFIIVTYPLLEEVKVGAVQFAGTVISTCPPEISSCAVNKKLKILYVPVFTEVGFTVQVPDPSVEIVVKEKE